MNIADILSLNDWKKILDTFQSVNKYDYEPENYQDIYDGTHDILSRADKIKTDSKGNAIDKIEVAKLVLNFQQLIVESAVAFLFGAPISINKNSDGADESFQYLLDNIENCHFHPSNKSLSRKLFIQRRAAKLYYVKNPDDTVNRKLACLVLSKENGTFYPNFNNYGDMDAFLRLYKTTELIDGSAKEIEKFELYTDTNIISGIKISEWETTSVPNPYGKIPVVFYEQDKVEWDSVDSLIKKQEEAISKLSDTNDYFSAPMVKLYGDVQGLPEKTDTGKVLVCGFVQNTQTGQLEKSDAEYLTWDQRPESLKIQFDLIEKYIYTFSNTADISFSSLLENKPGNISGAALKLLMLSPIIKSLNKQELFGENLKRELSVIKSILSVLDVKTKKDFDEMKLSITFNSILPENISEVIDYLMSATGAKPIMSQESAVNINPLVKNPMMEIERINNENSLEAGTSNI